MGQNTEAKIDMIISALSRGRTIRKAAREAGVPLRTAERYAADPKVQDRVREAKARMNGQVLGRYLAGLMTVPARLARIVGDDKADPETRIRAARALESGYVNLLEALDPGGASDRPTGPGLTVPGMDERWRVSEGGPPCSTPTD